MKWQCLYGKAVSKAEFGQIGNVALAAVSTSEIFANHQNSHTETGHEAANYELIDCLALHCFIKGQHAAIIDIPR
jgi:hypothetical protein